jgi:K+-transporting ATPase ATPase C chain
MSAPLSQSARQLLAGVRAMVVATVVLGLLYPFLMTGLAQLVAPGRADGSLLHAGGRVVGSSLIGQAFTDAKGAPLPRYFQSRPSASGYDGAASGGSNLGPDARDLVKAVTERRAAVAAFEHVSPAAVPPDAVTASASGLDAGISPAYAALQVARVARARGVSPGVVRRLVDAATVDRDLGFIGTPYVDVLELNLALDRTVGGAS